MFGAHVFRRRIETHAERIAICVTEVLLWPLPTHMVDVASLWQAATETSNPIAGFALCRFCAPYTLVHQGRATLCVQRWSQTV
jgi:hypothetical protein